MLQTTPSIQVDAPELPQQAPGAQVDPLAQPDGFNALKAEIHAILLTSRVEDAVEELYDLINPATLDRKDTIVRRSMPA